MERLEDWAAYRPNTEQYGYIILILSASLRLGIRQRRLLFRQAFERTEAEGRTTLCLAGPDT
jgi:hypothetical protein